MADNGNPTIPGAVASLGKSLITTLPPAFLLLVLINVAFIGFLMWFLEDQLEQRDAMAKQLFDRCLEMTLKVAP
jgi:hypothetical protein